MKYIDGVTGEILNESALIKNNTKNIIVDGDVYQIMRTLLKICNPDTYTDNSTISSEGGIMTFYTPEEYEQTTKIMKKMGLKYSDTSINNAKKDPNNDVSEKQMSPYPSNNGIKKNRVY